MKLLLLLCATLLFMNVFYGQQRKKDNGTPQDWPNLNKYATDNARILESANYPEVVFMGNSITEMWAGQFPTFFETHNFLGRGISGQTTPQMLIRFTQDVTDLKPRAVVILAGTNDIAGNTGFSTEKMITDNITAMAKIAEAHNIRVILCSILPVYDYAWRPGLKPAQKIVSINTFLETYAREHGHVFVDFHQAMKDERNGMQTLYSEDGVHPNAEGYRVMEPLILKGIEKALHTED